MTDESMEREVSAIYSAIERSPREFADAMGRSEEFSHAFMSLAARAKEVERVSAYAAGQSLKDRIAKLDTRIEQDSAAVTSAWALWNKWRRNDAELTGHERNLAKRWARLVDEYVQDQAERNLEACGPDYYRAGGAL